MDMQQFLGIVEDGRFQLLDPPESHDLFRFTSIAMREARSPESGELDLSGYEDKAIIIEGNDGGGWVYEAAVIDQAGPILTRVIRKVFEPERQRAGCCSCR
jgi:hypothetical protein